MKHPKDTIHAGTARALEFEYTPRLGTTFTAGYAHLPAIGRRTTARHVMRGMLARLPLTVFESVDRVAGPHGVMLVSHTIYAVETPSWPRVAITPRPLVSRWLARVGRCSGLVLDDPVFNRLFRVETDDENFAITLLSRELQWQLTTKTTVRWHLDAARLHLVYRGPLRPGRIGASLERLRAFVNLIPEELAEWAAGPETPPSVTPLVA